MRRHDWASTMLGLRSGLAHSLKTAVDLMLRLRNRS
jgi:hypothetical protein